MCCDYNTPVAEDVHVEYLREIDGARDVHQTFTEKTDGGKFLYVHDLLTRHGWLPQGPVDGGSGMRLSRAHRRWRKRLKKSLKRTGTPADMDCAAPAKSNGRSDECRARGNAQYAAGEYLASLRTYTLSMALAEAGSVSYALSVANRSAALYCLRDYGRCVRDVDRTFESDAYPPHGVHKLFERKGNCYAHMGRAPLALQMYSCCLFHLNQTTQIPLAEKEKINIRITKCIKKCEKPEENTKTKCISLSKTKSLNNIPALSDFVEIKYSKDMGRGLFVSKHVKPGEILLIERPIAGVFKNKMRIFNCDYCFKQCLTAVPCSKCSRVLYCDETCLQIAFDSYHRVECSMVNPLKGDPTVEPTFDLAMRCFIQLVNTMGIDRYCMAVQEYSNKTNSMVIDRGERNGEDDSASTTDAFRSIYSLDGNETKRTVSNLFFMYCTASMVVSMLLLNGFHIPSNVLGTVGESLVHLLCVVNSNSYASNVLTKYVENTSDDAAEFFDQPATHSTVALILCSTYSLINHSCDPNVIVQTHDGIEVTRAVQPISKGSQIFVDYGVNFMSHNKNERNEHLLEQYQFQCQCHACIENWPTYTSQEFNELYINHLTDLNEENQLDIPKIYLTKFNSIVHLLLTKQKINVDNLDFLFSFLDLLYINLKKPCIIYYKCIQLIHKCLCYT